MLNIVQVHHFWLVVREGSFARAADLANITQPALSNSVRSLEQRLGFQLLERSSRPIVPTPEGRRILPRVEALLFEARNLDQSVQNLTSSQTGHLRLGMTAVYSTSSGGAIIAALHGANPRVKIDLVVAETVALLQGLRDEAFDLIIGDARDLPADAEDLDLVALPSQPGGAFCRPGHPILGLSDPQPGDLARYRFAGSHFPTNVIDAFARIIGHKGPDPVIAVDSHNIAALRDAAAESDLILLTTTGAVRNALVRGTLVQVPIRFAIDGRWLIATRRSRVQHRAIPRLIDKILALAAQDRLEPVLASTVLDPS